MQNAVVIERFDVLEKQKILAFLKTAYEGSPRRSDEKFWDWHFVENPLFDSEKTPIWVAKSGDEIVGQLATIPVELKVGDAIQSSVWILDFVVDPKFRRQGIGKRIVAKAMESYDVLLGVNTHEQHSPELLESLGWKIVHHVPRFHKLLFPGAAVREISKIKPLAKIADLGFAPFRPKFENKNLEKNENLRVIENFDSDFDELWNEAGEKRNCIIKRDSKMLEWQYLCQPYKKYDVLGFYENGKLRGYIVLFFRKSDASGAISKAAISDIFYHPNNAEKTIDALLKGALQLCLGRRAGGLVTDVIDPFVEKKLDELKFQRVKNPLLLMVKTNFREDLLYNEAEWFLTRGDSDTSIFEEPNL